MPEAYEYEGGELALFANAFNWKSYLRREIGPSIGGRVLEVGAGMGGTTRSLIEAASYDSWTCLEPDRELAARCEVVVGTLGRLKSPLVRVGATADLGAEEHFETILYIDVLEHIEDDAAELARAAAHLTPRGRLVVMSPAHQFLFTPFDAAIGHHRRYDRRSLLAVGPKGLPVVRCDYLDSVGMLASMGNRLLLQQKMPTHRQIAVWDRLMIPASAKLDRALGHRIGKSILMIWGQS